MESHSPRWHSIDECFVFLKWPVRILAYTMRSKTTKREMHVFCLTGLRGSCGIRSMRSYLLEMGYLDFAICDSARNGADRNIMRLTMRVKFNGSIWWRELYFLITDDSNLATNDLTGKGCRQIAVFLFKGGHGPWWHLLFKKDFSWNGLSGFWRARCGRKIRGQECVSCFLSRFRLSSRRSIDDVVLFFAMGCLYLAICDSGRSDASRNLNRFIGFENPWQHLMRGAVLFRQRTI